jgi:hypothetical protein
MVSLQYFFFLIILFLLLLHPLQYRKFLSVEMMRVFWRRGLFEAIHAADKVVESRV